MKTRADKPTFTQQQRHIGFTVDNDIYERLKLLVRKTGVSINFALRRSIVEMINTGQVPMPGAERPEELEAVREEIVVSDVDQRVAEIEEDLESLQERLAALRSSNRTVSRTQTPVIDDEDQQQSSQRSKPASVNARKGPLSRVR